jgi:hypothetical protein
MWHDSAFIVDQQLRKIRDRPGHRRRIKRRPISHLYVAVYGCLHYHDRTFHLQKEFVFAIE